jgi:mRNA-degrading endonuclease RelE of RelBE toxin-antitoxin system
MAFEIVFNEKFTQDAGKLDGATHEMVEKRLRKIVLQPRLGKPLHGEANLFSERLEGLRIIYRIEGTKILFLRIGKRDEVYRQ